MYANNETGMIQPIAAIGAVAKEKGVAFHVTPSSLRLSAVRPLEEGIDMLTICSHKIYGPKGVGALYIRHGLKVTAEATAVPRNIACGPARKTSPVSSVSERRLPVWK